MRRRLPLQQTNPGALLETLETRRLFAGEYHLTFDDEFNSFNTTRWSTTDYWANRTLSGNAEQEWYSDTAHNGYNPFSVSGGILTIKAEPTPAGVYSGPASLPYVSGEITSADYFTQRYGYFELRAKLPAGKGLWPAFWLLPDDGSWPPEYDIFEVLGHDTDSIYQTAHWKDALGAHKSQGMNYAGHIDSATGFHTYGFLWDATNVKWYVDGVLTQTQVNRHNMPMYALINLAVGGTWPGNPDATTLFPAQMQLDYMRVYSSDPSLPDISPDSGYSPSSYLPVTVEGIAPVQLPSGWTATTVGTPAIAGSVTYSSSLDEWMLKCAGAIEGVFDAFAFVYSGLSGDGGIRATVQTQTNTTSLARTGVMLRNGLASSTAYAAVLVRPNSASPATSSIVTFQYRTAVGNSSTAVVIATPAPRPIVLRIMRVGNVFTGYYSMDGSTWSVIGSQTIAMGATLQSGIAMASATSSMLGRSTFSNAQQITPPAFSAFQVNDGQAQRSMVSSLQVSLSSRVTPAADAFTITRRGSAVSFSVNRANPSGDGKTFVLTFSDAGIIGDSVPDGIYDITIKAASLVDPYGLSLAGGNRVLRFHRLFGDADGDRDVDSTDLYAFRAAFRSPSAYRWYFDYNNDDVIGNDDYQQLKQRLTMKLFR